MATNKTIISNNLPIHSVGKVTIISNVNSESSMLFYIDCKTAQPARHFIWFSGSSKVCQLLTVKPRIAPKHDPDHSQRTFFI